LLDILTATAGDFGSGNGGALKVVVQMYLANKHIDR
jgi:hypothetical protein